MTILIVGGDPHDWGFIPTFLNENDPRPAREQFDTHYIGGWRKFDGFKFDATHGILKYPGDPPMPVKSTMLFRNEHILLFDHSWVLIMQRDGEWEVARMD